MYAIIWYYNPHGSLIKHSVGDDESLREKLSWLHENKRSYHMEYGDDA